MSRRTILLVDDQEPILEVLAVSLQPWAERKSMTIEAYTGGEAALEALGRKHESVWLIVSDMKMPGMSGPELLARIRELYPDIMTILMTGYSDVAEIAKAVRTGVFSFVLKPFDREYMEAEIEKAFHVFTLREENRRFLSMIQEDMRWGGELQRAFLRLAPTGSERVSFRASCLPLAQMQCGGDFYDVIPLGGDRFFCLIGDVAGHGIKAAFITFMIKGAVRDGYLGSVDPRDAAPDALLAWLNKRLSVELAPFPNLIVSFSACLLDAAGMRLSFANAGHLPLFLLHGERVRKLAAQGMGLGFSADAAYEADSLKVTPGDMLVLHTDGLRELRREMSLDEDAFVEILKRCLAAADFHAAVLGELRAMTETGEFIDDATLLTARMTQ